MIINGNSVASKLKSDLKIAIKKLKTKPGLGIILVGNNKPSRAFVANKIKFCQEVGIRVKLVLIKKNSKKLRDEIETVIKKFNKSELIHGIILQLPLPTKLLKYQTEIFKLIAAEKDIDCFNPMNLGLLNSGNDAILPAVVGACLEILEIYKVNLKGKTVLVVGWGQVVGKPLLPALLQKEATVIVCNEYTNNLKDLSRKADIIISAVGKPKIIKGEMVKKGVVGIDIGYSFKKGKIYGDFDFASLNQKAQLITPVPGGIGPVTVAMVAKNTLECYLKLCSRNRTK
jgi:methylenetetrahydrofolate dehydrogenase (NADP+)/methenyltetrahydrofolate cyclohydrolase